MFVLEETTRVCALWNAERVAFSAGWLRDGFGGCDRSALENPNGLYHIFDSVCGGFYFPKGFPANQQMVYAFEEGRDAPVFRANSPVGSHCGMVSNKRRIYSVFSSKEILLHAGTHSDRSSMVPICGHQRAGHDSATAPHMMTLPHLGLQHVRYPLSSGVHYILFGYYHSAPLLQPSG